MLGVFSAIGSVVGNMLGTDQAAASMIEKVSSGLDKLHYGAQEKEEDRQKMIVRGQEVMLTWLESTKGQNIARRVIALTIVFSWLGMYFLMVACNFMSIWWSTQAADLVAASAMMGNYAREMNENVMLILMFYFAAPHMQAGVEAFTAHLKTKNKEEKF